MALSLGSVVKFKAAPDGPTATVGNGRKIREVDYYTVAWVDERGGFKSIEVPAHLLFEVKESTSELASNI